MNLFRQSIIKKLTIPYLILVILTAFIGFSYELIGVGIFSALALLLFAGIYFISLHVPYYSKDRLILYIISIVANGLAAVSTSYEFFSLAYAAVGSIVLLIFIWINDKRISEDILSKQDDLSQPDQDNKLPEDHNDEEEI